MEIELSGEEPVQEDTDFRQIPNQDLFQLLEAKLEEGEVEYVVEVIDRVDQSIRTKAEFQLLKIEALCGCGNFDEAQKYAEEFCRSYPKEFIGLRWITFLEVVNEKRSFEEQEKSTRIRTIASDELKSLLSSGIANYEDLCEKIILSEKYDFSFKEYLLHTSISQVPTDAQRGYLEENLIQRFKSWTAQHQLLWIAACLRNSFSKDVSKLFNQLRRVIPNPSLEISDLVGIISLVNTSVANSNNMSAFIQRYQCLSEVYSVLTSRLENLIPDSRKTNLAKTRSSGKRIAIFCAPLIHINHAPSNRVLEISATLKKRYGYKVKIFAGGTFHYNVNSAGAIFSTNAMKIPKEDETLDFNGEAIPIWTSYMDDSQYKKHLETLNNILNFKPDAVVVLSDCHPVQNLLKGVFPTLLIPTNCSPPVGDMDKFFSLWRQDALQKKITMGLWPEHFYQKAVFGPQIVNISKPKYKISRKNLIPEADLILVLVGSRLADEIRGSFATRLADFLSQRSNVFVLFIGGKDAEKVMGQELKNHVQQIRHVNYVDNLTESLSGCDIVLNPPRQGGGTGIALAMSVGCAVVSLDGGDGATLIDPDDLCADLDEYFERLAKLTDSRGFRLTNQTRAKHQVNVSIDFERGMNALVDGIQDLLESKNTS